MHILLLLIRNKKYFLNSIAKKKVTFNSIVDSIDYKEDDINDMKFIKET